jgi:hypothetical protein
MSHAVARKEPAIVEDIGTDAELYGTQNGDSRTPSWFSRDISIEAGEVLAERYRTSERVSLPVFETPGPEAYEDYKKRLEEKFSQAQRLYDPLEKQSIAELRPTLPLSDIHGRRRLYEQEQREHLVRNPHSAKQPFSWSRFAALAGAAIIVGGGAGFGAANIDRISGFINNPVSATKIALAGLITPSLPASLPLNQTTIQKKTIATASLDVNDVRGTLNSMIPLMLSAQASDENNPLAVKIMGLPQDAYLTAGVETSKGSWLLNPADIAGVKLVVPKSDTSQLRMEVAAIEKSTGALAAPVKEMNVQFENAKPAAPVVAAMTQTGDGKSELESTLNIAATIAPTNAPPETAMPRTNVAIAIPAALPEASDLISKADGLLNSGDIASARQYYMRASEMGDANGAFGVGRTYDPMVFKALNVQGLRPDPIKAADWYKKAASRGVEAANNALASLQVAQP